MSNKVLIEGETHPLVNAWVHFSGGVIGPTNLSELEMRRVQHSFAAAAVYTLNLFLEEIKKVPEGTPGHKELWDLANKMSKDCEILNTYTTQTVRMGRA